MAANERAPSDPSSFAGTSEHSHQVALFAAVAQYVVRLGYESEAGRALKLLHAIPNGGTRGGDKRSAMIAGANMKAEGAKPGVSDIMLPVARHGYHGFYIEMKAPGKGRRVNRSGVLVTGESEEQIAWGKAVSDEGYLYAVFDSWSDALRALMWYLGFEHSLNWPLP